MSDHSAHFKKPDCSGMGERESHYIDEELHILHHGIAGGFHLGR
jgi:hypothetical protein